FLPTIDPLLVGADRAVKLALPALDEALRAVGPAMQQLRTRLVLCMDEQLGISGPDGRMPGATVGAWAIQHAALHAPQTSLETVARGPAGPGFALQGVYDALARGSIEAAVLGGVHTDYDPARVRALAQAGRLFKPDNLDSIIPGELAAFVVLMRPDIARMYKLAPLAQLFSVATAYDKVRPDNDE